MENGPRVMIFCSEDIGTPPGSDLMEQCCSLEVITLIPQQRFSILMEAPHRVLIYSTQASKYDSKQSSIDIGIFSYSCLIDEGDTFLITGNEYSSYTSTVSRYNSQGWISDLNNLTTGRSNVTFCIEILE